MAAGGEAAAEQGRAHGGDATRRLREVYEAALAPVGSGGVAEPPPQAAVAIGEQTAYGLLLGTAYGAASVALAPRAAGLYGAERDAARRARVAAASNAAWRWSFRGGGFACMYAVLETAAADYLGGATGPESAGAALAATAALFGVALPGPVAARAQAAAAGLLAGGAAGAALGAAQQQLRAAAAPELAALEAQNAAEDAAAPVDSVAAAVAALERSLEQLPLPPPEEAAPAERSRARRWWQLW